ncbi:outer membrane beta-barrel protein [Pontibacter harenae]|uniref:outer membrane beta-barrel protein n=1 Tax=Pontibacter harenae TaxID=2894083 RepID=UPI001E6341E7|nr:outer membrane beta-barrel protein [Pontibacter harenae]MCC9165816.1 PorT family protein [Pontibacter harenae]
MSSARDKKHGELEEEFRHLMHDAEATPSPDLWARIDHDLTVMENKKYKERFVLYRQLAAACFVLFMLAGALLTYQFAENGDNSTTPLAGSNTSAGNGIALGDATTATPKDVTIAAADANPATAEPSVNGLEATGSTAGSAVPQAMAMQKPTDNNSGESYKAVAGENTSSAAGTSIATGTMAMTSTTDRTAEELEQPASRAISARAPQIPLYIKARDAITRAGAGNEAGASEIVQPLVLRTPGQSSLAQLLKEQTDEQSESLQNKQVEALTLALNSESKQGGGGDNSKEFNSRWSVDMAYMPSYFNQNINLPNQMMGAVAYSSFVPQGPAASRQSSDNMEQAREEFDENTNAAFSYSMEVKTGFKIGKKFKLLTGVGYSQNTAKTKTSYVLEQYWFRPSTNERYDLNPTTIFLPSLNNNFSTDSLSVAQTDPFSVNYRYRLLSLPLGLQYEGDIAKDWFWYSAAGVAANFLIETEVVAATDRVEDVRYGFSDESPFRRVQFSGNIGLGVGKRISKSMQVVVGPEFRHFFSSMLSAPDEALTTQSKPYTIGVNMGVNYLIGKK